MRGKFVVLDGIDGCGKTSLLAQLEEFLAPTEIEVVHSVRGTFRNMAVHYFALRFGAGSGWAAGRWMIGVAGPVFDDDPLAYLMPREAFSHFRSDSETSCEDEVEEYRRAIEGG